MATPARMARSMTAWAVTESTPSGVVQTGISSVGGPLGRIARRVLARREGRLRCAVVGRLLLSVRATPRPYATGRRAGTPTGAPGEGSEALQTGCRAHRPSWHHGRVTSEEQKPSPSRKRPTTDEFRAFVASGWA